MADTNPADKSEIERPKVDTLSIKLDQLDDPGLKILHNAGRGIDQKTAGQFPAEIALLASLQEPQKQANREAIERDDKTRIRRINHPDGSFDTVEYDSSSELKVVRQYDRLGKMSGEITASSIGNSPTRLTIGEDGTIKKDTFTVLQTGSENIYDKKGNLLGVKGQYLSRSLFEEIYKPDGSHSIQRTYPDKSTRKYVFKPGEPNTYQYKSDDCEEQNWQQKPGTNEWYEARDLKQERPWRGTEEFRRDGRLVRTGLDGNVIAELSKDGVNIPPDSADWKSDALAAARENIAEEFVLRQFEDSLEGISQRVKEGRLSELEAAKTFQQLYRGLTTKSQVGVSDQNMLTLTRQIAYEQAHPEVIDQGVWNNCHSEAPRVKLSHSDSSVVAKLQLDAAITGKYQDTRHTLVDVSKSLEPADAQSLRVPPDPNVRSYSGQLFDLVVQNLTVTDLNSRLGTKLEYIQRRTSVSDNGARLVDNGHQPAKEIYSFDEKEQPIHSSKPIVDDKGVVQLDASLQAKMTKPLEGMELTIQDSLNIAERLTGRRMAGQAIGHYDQVAGAWIWDNIGLASNVRKDSRIPFFKNETELEALLLHAKRHGELPIILETNSAGGRLGQQVAEAAGKPLGGEGGNFGAGHVLCIINYNEFTKTSDIDNTWGLARDIKDATLKEIIDMSRQPEYLREKQVEVGNDAQMAYQLWCGEGHKKPNVDYPTPSEGRIYLERFRRKIGHVTDENAK